MASIPGLRQEDVFDRLFAQFLREERSNLVFTEPDVGECDASHFRALHIFVGLILKHVAPKATLLRKAFLL